MGPAGDRLRHRPSGVPVIRLAGVAVAAVLLTGCGAVPDLNPGVAVRVGDDTVTTRDVADLAADYCDAAASQLTGQALPRHYLNSRVAGSLAVRSAADQLMDDRGVTVDASYDAAVKQAEGQLASLKPAERAAIVSVQGSEIYVTAAETAVGRDELGGSASDEDVQAAGEKALLAWIDD